MRGAGVVTGSEGTVDTGGGSGSETKRFNERIFPSPLPQVEDSGGVSPET